MTTTSRRRAVLITGATGVVGAELVNQLREDNEVVGVSRRGSPIHGVLAWDMANDPPPSPLRRQWDAIVNAAANTRWTMSHDEAATANVTTVRALADLASASTHVVQVSTAYAIGLREDVGSSNPEDFRNAYEWSKAYAERVARELFARLTIVRPPLIIGRRGDGRAARFSGMYTLLRGLTAGSVPAIVAARGAYFDAIPVDDLGKLLATLTSGPRAEQGQTLTIAGGAAAPKIDEAIRTIIDSLNCWRRSHGAQPIDTPRLVPPDSWNRLFRPFVQEHLSPRQLRILQLLRRFEPYLALEEPLRADCIVRDVVSCLKPSIEYWATTNPRVAVLEPRPWRAN